jgi:hypothetical protein
MLFDRGKGETDCLRPRDGGARSKPPPQNARAYGQNARHLQAGRKKEPETTGLAGLWQLVRRAILFHFGR